MLSKIPNNIISQIKEVITATLNIKDIPNCSIYSSDILHEDILYFAQDTNEKNDLYTQKNTYKGVSLFPYKNRTDPVIILNSEIYGEGNFSSKTLLHEYIHAIHFVNYIKEHNIDINLYYYNQNFEALKVYSEFFASYLGDYLEMKLLRTRTSMDYKKIYAEKYYQQHISLASENIEFNCASPYSCSNYLGSLYYVRQLYNDRYGKLFPMVEFIQQEYHFSNDLFKLLSKCNNLSCSTTDIENINRLIIC